MGKDVTLEQWLELMEKRPKNVIFEDYQFPTDEIKEQFLSNISSYPEKTITMILDSFLLSSGFLGSDKRQFDYIMDLMRDNMEEAEKALNKFPYYKRLIDSFLSGREKPVRDGIKWIIDILPFSPREALDALDAYYKAHMVFLPDGRSWGLEDAKAILRARYFSTDSSIVTSIFNSLKPADLEYLVESLYHAMKFTTEMTKPSHDGGRDIIAIKNIPGYKEKNLIQCKRWQNVVGVEDVRALLGVVSDEKATKGTLITTSYFSPDAKKLANRNSQIDLIAHEELQRLLSEYLGTRWITRTDYLIGESIKRHPLNKRK